MRGNFRSIRLVLAAALVAAGTACSGDGGTAPPDPDPPVVGSWRADTGCQPPCAFALRADDDPDLILDLLSIFGGELRVVVTRTRFELVFDPVVGAQTLEIRGDLEIRPSQLVVTDGGDTEVIEYAVQDDRLELRFMEVTSMFDLDGDGEGDPARLGAVLLRQ